MEQKNEILIQIVCLIIIFVLCVGVYIHGKSLSCNSCIIKFTQYRTSGVQLPEPIIKRIKLIDLYSNLSDDGYCLIKWDKVGGYVIG